MCLPICHCVAKAGHAERRGGRHQALHLRGDEERVNGHAELAAGHAVVEEGLPREQDGGVQEQQPPYALGHGLRQQLQPHARQRVAYQGHVLQAMLHDDLCAAPRHKSPSLTLTQADNTVDLFARSWLSSR